MPPALAAVVRRCLEPDPKKRFQSAADLASALDGCRELRHVEKALPPAGPLTRASARAPLLMGCILALLPHLLGSVVNVTYNAVRIVGHLTHHQEKVFFRSVLGYNAVVYPICLALMLVIVMRVRRARRRWRGRALPMRARRRPHAVPSCVCRSGLCCYRASVGCPAACFFHS